VLYFDGCPNHEALLPRLREILGQNVVPAEIDLQRITDEDAARRARFSARRPSASTGTMSSPTPSCEPTTA